MREAEELLDVCEICWGIFMNYINDNNKEAKIYGKDNESCERLE